MAEMAAFAAASGAISAAANVVSAAAQAKPAFLDPLRQALASSDDPKDILYDLVEDLALLSSKKKDLQNEVERYKMMVPSETYNTWVQRVVEIEHQVEILRARFKRPRYSNSLPSNFDKEIKKNHKQVCKLLEECNQISDKLLVQRPPEPVVIMRAPDITKLDTLRIPLERILKLLKNEKVKCISIQGTVGIGKTTIMLNLNNHKDIAEMFEIVIWLKISTEGSKENLSREVLQKAILRRLRVNLRGCKSSDDFAHRISRELEGKKFLILMDDVKQDLNLYDIGIPISNKNDSKIVLTTRWGPVCSSLVTNAIKVRNLSTDEAWKMFRDIMQCPTSVANPKVMPLAWRVCNECGGIPLVIEKVANTFKVINLECLWKDGLDSWRSWPQKERQGIFELYNIFKFCYDNLDDIQKKCFLYGALYPEESDIYIDYLLERWEAEDFFVNDVQHVGHFVLIHLMQVSLLEKSKSDKLAVSMHKFIRQVALYIISDDPRHKYMIKTNGAVRDLLDAEHWSHNNHISLCDNEFDKLPDCPDCSTLSTLFLQRNINLETVPELFFEKMKELRVLDLSETGIVALPASLSKLIRLKVLCLYNCKELVQLPSAVGEVSHLEVLDIQGSGVRNIPIHIENLKGLKHLRISFTQLSESGTLEVDSFDIISKLSALEEIVIGMQSFEQWNKVVRIIVQKVANLDKLTTLKFCFPDKVVDVIKAVSALRIHVPDTNILQDFVNNCRLWKSGKCMKPFEIFITSESSGEPHIPDFYKYDRYIKYCNGKDRDPPIPIQVLSKADAFELVNHNDIKKLADFVTASMNQIRSFLLESCKEIETIIDTMDCIILPNVEHLYMKRLPKLESIWKEPMQSVSLTKLQTLVLTSCHALTLIFPGGLIQQLVEMQHIEIEDCSGIVEIFQESETIGCPYVLPKLKKLILIQMPNLEFICKNASLKWPSLEKLKVYKCPRMRGVFVTPGHNAPKLKVIDLSELH